MLIFHIFQLFTLLIAPTWAQDFTVTFDLNWNAARYRQFIQNLRTRLRDGNLHSHGIPVLPPQPASENELPTRFFDVVFTGGSLGSLRVRFRRDNLYMVGYQRNETNAQWYEANLQTDPRLIPGSQPLGLRPTYSSLENMRGSDHRRSLDHHRQSLVNATEALMTATTGASSARYIIILAGMISESTRIRAITVFIHNNWNRNHAYLPERLIGLENAWRTLSGEVLHQDQVQEPNNRGQLRIRMQQEQGLGLETLTDILDVLGILLRQHVGDSGPISMRRRDSVEQVAGNPSFGSIESRQTSSINWILPGRPLVEIFSVQVDNIDGLAKADLAGGIYLKDPLAGELIYVAQAETISPGDDLTLVGPSRVMNAADDWSIHFGTALKDDSERGILQGSFTWSRTEDYQKVFNEVKTYPLGGSHGNGKFVYAVMRNAAEALINVAVVDSDGAGSVTQVSGSINSWTSKFPKRRIKLFTIDKGVFEKEEGVTVQPDKTLLMWRHAVAVPMQHSLSISVDLWNHNAETSLRDQLALGNAKFRPQLLQSVVKRVKGEHGEVEIRVSWL